MTILDRGGHLYRADGNDSNTLYVICALVDDGGPAFQFNHMYLMRFHTKMARNGVIEFKFQLIHQRRHLFKDSAMTASIVGIKKRLRYLYGSGFICPNFDRLRFRCCQRVNRFMAVKPIICPTN